MVAEFPTDLLQVEEQPYRFGRGDGRLPGKNDAGPPVPRGRYSAVTNSVTITLVLSRSQVAQFDVFYDEQTSAAKKPFLFPDPLTDGWPLLDDLDRPILTEEGSPLLLSETWLVIFGQRLPDVAKVGTKFRVNFDLVILP